MNKKIITLCLAAALSVAPMAVFAETEGAEGIPATELSPAQKTEAVDVDGVPETTPDEEEQREVSFVSHTATVKSITKEDDGTYLAECEDENKEPMHVRISSELKAIFDNAGKTVKAEEIKEGDELIVYDRANKPMILIYPPLYTPDVLIVNDKDIYSTATVDKFVVNGGDETSLINEFGTLVLNIGTDEDSKTEVVDLDGNKVSRTELDGRDLCVFYSITTFSIPPQTPPEKIVVLPKDENNENVDNIEDNGDINIEPEVTPFPEIEPIKVTKNLVVNGKEINLDSVVTMGDHDMLPVRAVAEAMDLEVAWDGGLKAVTVGTVPMGVNFRIDVDSYYKSRMMPFTFGQAPVLIDDVTYVPVEFFAEVLEAEITNDGDKTIINLQ